MDFATITFRIHFMPGCSFCCSFICFFFPLLCLHISFFLVGALWSRISNNPDESAGSLARPIALALPCSLCLRTLLHSLICSLAHFPHSLARGTVNDSMAIFCGFFLFWTIVLYLSSHFFFL